MALMVCNDCGTLFAVGLAACPQCRGTGMPAATTSPARSSRASAGDGAGPEAAVVGGAVSGARCTRRSARPAVASRALSLTAVTCGGRGRAGPSSRGRRPPGPAVSALASCGGCRARRRR